MEETSLKNKNADVCFKYLKELAEYVNVQNEKNDDNGDNKEYKDDVSFLSKQYKKISTISPRSVLSLYLEKKPLKSEEGLIQLIFPFGFNLSQKTATEKALTEQLSVIEGPPGTGKTQTILNIIANAVINNKTVAVVSNNNSATANVFEKLQKYDVDFIAASLGNNKNKEKFFEGQKKTYPISKNWALPPSNYQSIRDNLTTSQLEINKMLESQNKLAVLKQELSALQTEFRYFDQYYNQLNLRPIELHSMFPLNADRFLSILFEYRHKIGQGDINFFTKLYNLVIYGIYSFEFYKNTPEAAISYLQKTYYNRKMEELKSQISFLSNKLDSYNFDYAIKEYATNSMRLFKANLANKYGIGKTRKEFSDKALWNDLDSFQSEYPVILSTTHSLRSCVRENYLFDYVIIDEASQVDLVAGALALSCAKNAVIVGDIKQLPNVVPNEIAKETRRIFETYNLDRVYNYAENSLLSSIISLYKDVPKTLLREHYRCHPKIIGFCNQKFYNNQLIILTDERENNPLIVYKTEKGNHARGHYNQRQIDVIIEEIIPRQNKNLDTQSVGIVTPYRLQVEEIKKNIGTLKIDVDTVHKYQGRERDMIVLSTVANKVNANSFVDNSNLLNVAVSRAVNKLIVVVAESGESWTGTNIGDLIRYIKYNNLEIIQSEIYSVFDLLYSSYSDKLIDFMKSIKRVSEYKSENLMNMVIEKVLSLPEFQNFDRVLHQPLKMLIRDPTKLNEDESRYAMNILTHTDFVIFNKLDKMPVLVVEVDGWTFHKNNKSQIVRDQIKDVILKKYDIPILRIKTNESGEERRLIQKLKEILKMEP